MNKENAARSPARSSHHFDCSKMADDANAVLVEAALGQRTTGRRAKRRRTREEARRHTNAEHHDEQSAPPADADDATATASLAETSSATAMTSRKGPSDDIQSRIDAAILARAGHGVGTASVTQHHESAHMYASETAATCTCTPSHDESHACTRKNAARQVMMMDPDIIEGGRYEYLDHTADVQLHSWGTDLPSALEQLALAMFGYMTRLQSISIDERTSDEVASHVVARGHDLHSMVFAFLDEWLFVFHDTGFVAREVEIVHFDRECWQITSRGRGEILDLDKHPQGTEVKAITYSNMQIQENGSRIEEKREKDQRDGDLEKRCDVWVIVDI